MIRTRLFYVVALVLPLAILFALAPLEAKPTASSTTAFAYLPAVANNCLPSVYYGVYVPGWLDNLDALTTFENDTQKKVSIVMWYQGWGLTDGTQYFQTSWMNNARNHGSIPMVTWEPWLYTAPDPKENQPDYQLSKIINGDFDSYIERWADDSKAWGHPYFLRFAAEMNGNWFPWSEQANGNQPGQYVQAWKHVHKIFTDTGVTNVAWVWSPNIEYNGSTPLEELYPGDDYVDWLGMDGYNWGTVPHRARTASLEGSGTSRNAIVTGWQTFSEIFSQTYTHITALSTKPLLVAETASAEQGGSKAQWITDTYSIQIPSNFEKIKAIIWFNENKETDWRIESSSTAQNAFATAIQPCFYATNQYASLCESPIPMPSLIKRGGACLVYLPLVLE
jgi:mannan endo-1,4-beta-mannosidase